MIFYLFRVFYLLILHFLYRSNWQSRITNTYKSTPILIMSHSQSAQSIIHLDDERKFDGTNWLIFKDDFIDIVCSCGIECYLDKTVVIPSPIVVITPSSDNTTRTLTTPVTTPYYLLTPNIDEYCVRRDYTMSLLKANIVTIDGIRIDWKECSPLVVWDFLCKTYDHITLTDLSIVTDKFNAIEYTSGTFHDHIVLMWKKRGEILQIGGELNEKAFVMRLFKSLPESWDLIVSSLKINKLLTEVGIVAESDSHYCTCLAPHENTMSTFRTNHALAAHVTVQKKPECTCYNPYCVSRKGTRSMITLNTSNLAVSRRVSIWTSTLKYMEDLQLTQLLLLCLSSPL